MATTNLYLDDRVLRKDGCAPLKVVLRNRGTVAHLPLGIAIPPQCWKDGKVILCKNKALDDLLPDKPTALNTEIRTMMAKINLAVTDICAAKSSIHASSLRLKVQSALEGRDVEAEDGDMTLIKCWEEYLTTIEKESSRLTLRIPLNFVIRAYKRPHNILLDDIDERWVEDFVTLMKKGNERVKPVSQNTASNYFTVLKTVWHFAHKRKYVPRTNDPFADITVSKVATRSRALEVEDVRKIWFYDADEQNDLGYSALTKERARDVFKLIICLCGINMADLYELKESDIRAGRLETDRRKTGVHINIKLEPEALEIIKRYKKDGYLIGKLRANSANTTSAKINAALSKHLPGLTIYWARHTWASLAVELDIPDRTVFMGLAHKQGSYSDETYITMRNRKLDEANRRIIDYILCGRT
jgi:integrase